MANNQNNGGGYGEDEHLRKIFIGGLTSTTTAESLQSFFEKWGNVVDAVVMKDPQTKKSRGFGFITYSESSMVDAAQNARPHTIDGRTIETKRAVPRDDVGRPEISGTTQKIYVGRLKDDDSEDQLREHFGQFGKIVGVNIVKDKEGKSRGFGFVEFDDYDPVDKLVMQKEHEFNGHPVLVKKSQQKAKDGNGGNFGGNRQGGNQSGFAGNNPGGNNFGRSNFNNPPWNQNSAGGNFAGGFNSNNNSGRNNFGNNAGGGGWSDNTGGNNWTNPNSGQNVWGNNAAGGNWGNGANNFGGKPAGGFGGNNGGNFGNNPTPWNNQGNDNFGYNGNNFGNPGGNNFGNPAGNNGGNFRGGNFGNNATAFGNNQKGARAGPVRGQNFGNRQRPYGNNNNAAPERRWNPKTNNGGGARNFNN